MKINNEIKMLNSPAELQEDKKQMSGTANFKQMSMDESHQRNFMERNHESNSEFETTDIPQVHQ